MKLLRLFVAVWLMAAPTMAYGQTGVPMTQIPQGRGAVMYTMNPDGTFSPVSASNPIPSGGATTFTTTDRGGTLDTGGAAETAIASNASRSIWCIQNDPAEEEVLQVRVGGTASATTGISLSPGQQACGTGQVDTSAVSVFAATTGHRWFGFEGE